MPAQAGQEQAVQKVTTTLTTSQSLKQVLDLKDRPWDGKPYTINNLPRPFILPLQGHVMERAIDWENPTCHRAPARSGAHRSCRNTHNTRSPSDTGGSRVRKESLPLPFWTTAHRNTALTTRLCTAALTLLELWARVLQVPESNIRHIKWNILIHVTTWIWWYHLPAAVRTTGRRARCNNGPTSQRCESTNSNVGELGKLRQILLMSVRLLIQLHLLLV